jgi:hypothetical protein
LNELNENGDMNLWKATIVTVAENADGSTLPMINAASMEQ